MTPEQKRAKARRRDPIKRYISQRRARANQEQRNKDKITARKAVQHALRSGKLVKKPCERCPRENWDVEAHHDDYSKPLQVKWLCNTHHKERHREMGGIGL